MASRYGPGVLPEPNVNFEAAIRGLQGGYEFGEGIRQRRRQQQWESEEEAEQRREWEEREQDRNRYLTQLRASEEAQPGAVSLASFLQQPSYKKEVDVGATKAQPASAGGRLVFNPKFAGRMYQTSTGAVVDREAARQEEFGDLLDRYRAQYGGQYFERSQFPTPTEKGREGKALATGAADATDAAALQTEYPDLRGLSTAETLREGRERRARDYANAHPAPARPRAGGGSGPSEGDRRLTALQRELSSAQADVESLERAPEYALWRQAEQARTAGKAAPAGTTDARYSQWLTRYQGALTRRGRAQRDVDAALHGGHQSRRPSQDLRPLPPVPER